jgi:hypothetical protein
MNIKIDKEQHEWLTSNVNFDEFLFGSRLLGNAKEDSDFDYLRVYKDSEIIYYFHTLGKFLPNIHAFQYTEGKEAQYIWMSESQFWKNFFSGDGSLLTDIVLYYRESQSWDALKLSYTYKVIKGLLGVTKRDLKKHKDWTKRMIYAEKSLYMAECLMDRKLPCFIEIKEILNKNHGLNFSQEAIQILKEKEEYLRKRLNSMLDNNEIAYYPEFKEETLLIDLMVSSNNIKEFRYE